MLTEPPRLTIRRTIDRPPADLLACFADAPTGWLTDAQNGRGSLDAAIKPIAPDVEGMARFAGPAITCWCGPNDNLALMSALSMVEPGDVLIAASEGFNNSGMLGDLLAGMAKNKGAAAIITDGMARDWEGLVGVGLPIYSRGITPNSCVRSGPGKIGFPIDVGGRSVSSGDLLVGDRDGVVVVPRSEMETVAAKLEQVSAAERAAEAAVKGGRTGLDEIAELLASDRVQYVD